MHETDEELVERATQGDTDAFNLLVKRWERAIYALAYRVLGRDEDARDVCQEAFMRAYRGLGRFKGQAKFSSWLYRIALNLCRDWLRRERRAVVVQPPEDEELGERALVDPINETVEDLILRRDLGRAVSKVMATLPADQRVVIGLKEYHGLTFREIAELVECPLSTVKTRLYQGLAELRRQLARRGVYPSLVARSG
jgi:RNA polymerase sigma-70 factor (ECF subfamily)